MSQHYTPMKNWIKDAIEWIKDRLSVKFTVPIHILLGMLCAFLFPYYPSLSILIVVIFLIFELWQSIMSFISGMKRKSYAYLPKGDEGYLDFLDLIVGLSTGSFILLLVSIAR